MAELAESGGLLIRKVRDHGRRLCCQSRFAFDDLLALEELFS
jgi:hypothetical protein